MPAWLEAQSPLPLGFGRIEAGTVARGEVRVRAGGREDRSGSIQAVLESRANEPMQLEPIAVMLRVEPLFEGEIVAEVARGRCGEHVRWSLALRNVGDAPAQCVRIGLCTDGAVYVPGSTTLDNALVCDRQGTSPLWNADGLILEDVAPGQSVALACTTALEPGFTDGDESAQARMWLRAAYLDRETIVESAPVTIERSVPVDVMLPYVVRNVTLERRSEERAPTPAISARAVSVRAIPARANEARFGVAFAQHVHSLRGLMRHLWALALLCTDSDGDPYLAALRSSARIALRSVFDRLAIKLRMPHYPVRVHDVLDAAALDALAALGEALLARGDAELARAIASPRLGIRLTAIAQLAAPLEGGDAVPVRRYVETLRRGLEPLDDVAVIDGLVAPQPELDDALDLILATESDTVAQVALA
ncbi:MAG: hypothetical protein JO101_06050 [Candidatus Eremiobacteraeota bacterium]|nr:hypothetical protein [Candidatus Eremiobacteraeota bacterium]